jgi:hypothetical protein
VDSGDANCSSLKNARKYQMLMERGLELSSELKQRIKTTLMGIDLVYLVYCGAFSERFNGIVKGLDKLKEASIQFFW